MIKRINKASINRIRVGGDSQPHWIEPIGADGRTSCPALDTYDKEARAGIAEPPLAHLLTIAEVARHCRMSERTVRRRIKDGTIRKALHQGRLVRISIDELKRIAQSEK